MNNIIKQNIVFTYQSESIKHINIKSLTQACNLILKNINKIRKNKYNIETIEIKLLPDKNLYFSGIVKGFKYQICKIQKNNIHLYYIGNQAYPFYTEKCKVK